PSVRAPRRLFASLSASFFVIVPSMATARSFFSFSAPTTSDVYTLSLHDALPICFGHQQVRRPHPGLQQAHARENRRHGGDFLVQDRKSTRLNSSHVKISYAVFCLKKKKYPLCPSSTSPLYQAFEYTPELVHRRLF